MREAVDRAQAKGIDNLTKQGIVDIGNSYLVAADYPEAEKYYGNHSTWPRNKRMSAMQSAHCLPWPVSPSDAEMPMTLLTT